MLQTLFLGVMIGLVFAAIIVLVIYALHNHLVQRIQEKVDEFAGAARKDIAVYQEGMLKSLQDHAEKLGKHIVDLKTDVEILKRRVGGTFSKPADPAAAATVPAQPAGKELPFPAAKAPDAKPGV
ncbi:MAG TPA: hypothetical protein VKF42_09845 [Chitinivibrionales bacterium]|nr:hypothetical protein [Chitinivibrionales bacterium]